jgi:hypothetical protein
MAADSENYELIEPFDIDDGSLVAITAKEAFALSVRRAKASAAIKERLMSMVQERKQVTHAPEMRVFL